MLGNSPVLMTVSARQKSQQQQLLNQTSNFYTSHTASNPGTINVVLGGAMLGSIIIFITWMCYFCRCKIPAPSYDENSSNAEVEPSPYWIEIPEEYEYDPDHALHVQNHRRCHRHQLEMNSKPPAYESIFTLPPTYEEAVNKNKSADDTAAAGTVVKMAFSDSSAASLGEISVADSSPDEGTSTIETPLEAVPAADEMDVSIHLETNATAQSEPMKRKFPNPPVKLEANSISLSFIELI